MNMKLNMIPSDIMMNNVDDQSEVSWDGGLSGIINLGNTCYLNTSIQMLSAASEFRSYFLNGDYRFSVNNRRENRICKELARLLKGMWEENCIVQPITFRKTFCYFDNRYIGFGQHDCSEALCALLEMLHLGLCYEVDIEPHGTPINQTDNMMIDSIKRWEEVYKSQYSEVIALFYGQFVSTLNTNNQLSHTYDPFNQLSLPIVDCSTLYECIDKFTSVEILELEVENIINGRSIKKVNHIEKQIQLWKTPKYLLIVLKRFSGHQKLDDLITFPINNLDMSNYCNGYDTDIAQYNLISIGNHISEDINEGHYFTFSKHDNEWYSFNDETVKKLDTSTSEKADEILITKHAYILLYERVEN